MRAGVLISLALALCKSPSLLGYRKPAQEVYPFGTSGTVGCAVGPAPGAAEGEAVGVGLGAGEGEAVGVGLGAGAGGSPLAP